MDFSKDELLPQLSFKTSRSGGKGGQHVNKVSSKVELNFDFSASSLFSDEQKLRLRSKLSNKLTAGGQIQIISEQERSQYLNKDHALNKLYFLLQQALSEQKPRKATKPRKAAVEQRLKEKQKQAVKKLERKKNFDI